MTDILLMDVKGPFNHFSRNELMKKMEKIGVDGDFVRSTGSFMSEKWVSLVEDGHQCEVANV